MTLGPLEDPRLLAVEHSLNEGKVELAQRQLATLSDVDPLSPGAAYLVTRILFARGRLNGDQVTERLRDVLAQCAEFGPALQFMEAVQEGREEFRSDVGDEGPPSSVTSRGERPPVEFRRVSATPTPEGAALPESGSYAVSDPGRPSSIPPSSSSPPPRPSTQAARAITSQGLYSEAVPDSELVRSLRRSSPVPPPRRSAPPPAAPTASVAAQLAEPRTGGPAAALAASVPRRDAWLDSGMQDRVPQREDAPDETPEIALLRAQALRRSGRLADAQREMEKLSHAPLLEPELRSRFAELLLELDRLDEALWQAQTAYEHDPRAASTRLTLAAVCLRAAWRSENDWSLAERANGLLQGLRARESAQPALVYALRACVQAMVGDPERVPALAQRALLLNPNAPEALVAVALASAQLGRQRDAHHAWLRLAQSQPGEADVIRAVLERHGVQVTGQPEPQPELSLEPHHVWEPIELDLVEARQLPVMESFEAGAAEQLRQAHFALGEATLADLAQLCAEWLTLDPITRHFAPFDFSLWSLLRVEACLDLIYGEDARPWLGTDPTDAIALLGAYWGETLHLTGVGCWSLAERWEDAFVTGSHGVVRPFERVRARLERGEPLDLDLAPEFGLDDPRAEWWQRHGESRLAPPTPWGSSDWPEPSELPKLGRALARSVVAVFGQRKGHAPLDRSLTSLGELDTYLALVAPVRAPRDPHAAWCRRLAVLIGAYVGETLCEALQGRWSGFSEPLDERSYQVQFAGGIAVTPVAHVLSRVTGRTAMSLVEYCEKVARRIDQPPWVE